MIRIFITSFVTGIMSSVQLATIKKRLILQPATFGWIYATGIYASVLFWIPEDMVYYYGEDRMSLGMCILTSPLWPFTMPFRTIGFFKRFNHGRNLKKE